MQINDNADVKDPSQTEVDQSSQQLESKSNPDSRPSEDQQLYTKGSSQTHDLSTITLVILGGILLILFIGMAVFLVLRLRRRRTKTVEAGLTDTDFKADKADYKFHNVVDESN